MYYDNHHYGEDTMAICNYCRFKYKVIMEKDLSSTYQYFKNTILKNLARTISHTSLIPKPYIYQAFFRMNDGVGLSSKEIEKILWCTRHYFNYLASNATQKYSLPIEMLLKKVMEFLKINKKFEVKIKRELPLWDKFIKQTLIRQSYLCKQIVDEVHHSE